ncbi:MAG: hypothetical protein WAN81_22110, partial [Candidatus Binataceae bacterium]
MLAAFLDHRGNPVVGGFAKWLTFNEAGVPLMGNARQIRRASQENPMSIRHLAASASADDIAAAL